MLSADFLVMCDSYYYRQPFIGMWAYSSKSSKFEIFGKNLPQGTNLLERFFFTKLGAGKESQVRILTPNFTIVALKMWLQVHQNRQNNGMFGINNADAGASVRRAGAADEGFYLQGVWSHRNCIVVTTTFADSKCKYRRQYATAHLLVNCKMDIYYFVCVFFTVLTSRPNIK